ncbi:MAG: hypothetical protein NT069_23000 [Planctomycetota bacterium]|nr:hypothetical protein [Planctomycetota bacterium]
MSREGEIYNGWTNFETWIVALWLGNERGSYEHWKSQAFAAAVCGGGDTTEPTDGLICRQDATVQLACELREHYQVNDNLELPGFYVDLLNASLANVNWLEIADHYICEIAGEEIEKEGRQ